MDSYFLEYKTVEVKSFWTIFIFLRKIPNLQYNILTTNFGNYLCIRCGYQEIFDWNSNNVKVEMDVSNGDTRRLRETGKQEVSVSIRLNNKTAMIWIVYSKPGGDPFLAFRLRFIWIYVFLGCDYFVCLRKYQSQEVIVKTAVPQALVFGPILFLIFVNDNIRKCISHSHLSCLPTPRLLSLHTKTGILYNSIFWS